jgi:putative transcriptional regulator
VSQEQIWLVYRNEDRFDEIEGQFDVGPKILATASRRVLEALGEGRQHSNVVGLAGYAGWAPSQLENEIRNGAWLPTDIDPKVVFDVPTEEVWQRAYQLIGVTPMSFTTRTVGLA